MRNTRRKTMMMWKFTKTKTRRRMR